MLSQDTAEKKEEGQAVDDAAGSDVPSRFTYKKGECTAAYPDGKEYIGSNMPVKVEHEARCTPDSPGSSYTVIPHFYSLLAKVP